MLKSVIKTVNRFLGERSTTKKNRPRAEEGGGRAGGEREESRRRAGGEREEG